MVSDEARSTEELVDIEALQDGILKAIKRFQEGLKLGLDKPPAFLPYFHER